MRTAKYYFHQSPNGEWCWVLVARNGEPVGGANGEGYKTRAGALRGIEAHRRAAATAVVRERPCPTRR